MRKKPNLFIVGAPKCGTSSLRYYLMQHPSIFMSDPKEPAFWATDLPGVGLNHSVPLRDERDYLALFRDTDERHLAIGEASTTYLASETAIKNIIAFNPHAFIIALIRDPVSLAYSWHHQKLWEMNETEPSFEKAWQLQEARAQGLEIPCTCRVPEHLQYRKMASLGTQVERLLAVVPSKQVRIFLLDDIALDPLSVYCETLSFMGIPYDGRTDFPVINEAKVQRFPLLNRLYYHPPKLLEHGVRTFRRVLRRVDILRSAKEWLMKRPKTKEAISEHFRAELESVFEPEVMKLQDLLQRDLSRWLR
jgi:hypothetical protein